MSSHDMLETIMGEPETRLPIISTSAVLYKFEFHGTGEPNMLGWTETLSNIDRTPTLEEQGWKIELPHVPRPGWQNYAQKNAPKRKGAKKQRSKYLRKRSKD